MLVRNGEATSRAPAPYEEILLPSKAATALLGAGAFSLALAGLVPTVIAPSMLKAPAEADVVTHSRSAAQKLNTATGEMEPITVDLTRTLKTHVKDGGKEFAGNSDTAVYQELLNLATVDGEGDVNTLDARGRYSGLRAGTAVIAFDRKTGAGKPGFEGDTYQTTGQTVKFPFDTQKKTYDYYDQTSRKAWPVEYERTTTLKGLEVYEFSGTIPSTELGQYGVLEGTTQIYENTGRTVFVEPVTGSIVSSETAPQTTIRFADGKVSPALMVENLVPTDETIADRVAEAKDAKSGAQTLKAAPWLLAALGALLLAAGAFLASRRRRSPEDGDAPTEVVDLDAPRGSLGGLLPPARSEAPVEPKHLRR